MQKTLKINIFKETLDVFSMRYNSRVRYKNSEICRNLYTHFGSSMNLARIKFFGLMICSLCKVQTVTFSKLASAFETNASSDSSLRRIQRFMAGYELDLDIIAKFVIHLLPHKVPYILSMDRTNWKFGETNINILALAVTYDGVAFPVLFHLMPKRGNSNTAERIDIMNRFIRLFGYESINYLVADREFVGEDWFAYLNGMRIKYHLRIRENFHVTRHGKTIRASWLFNDLRINESKHLNCIYYVNNQQCYLSGSCVKNKEGKPELQILVSFCSPKEALETYKERWQIETAFRALKSSGFNIEDTHLREIDRIGKLLSIVIIAFTWCYCVGIYRNEHIKKIRILKHKRRAVSLFKYGLDLVSHYLLNPYCTRQFDIYKFLSCT